MPMTTPGLLATVIAACSLTVPGFSHATPTEIVITGDAVSATGSCLLLAGYSSGATGRSRWAGGYWERITTPAPACSDTDPHFDPVVTCVEVATVGEPGSPGFASVASIAATGPARSTWYFKIVDRPLGVDEFGAATGAASAGPCGAGAVGTSPIASGGFVIAAQ